jgi:hypothetical protein
MGKTASILLSERARRFYRAKQISDGEMQCSKEKNYTNLELENSNSFPAVL